VTKTVPVPSTPGKLHTAEEKFKTNDPILGADKANMKILFATWSRNTGYGKNVRQTFKTEKFILKPEILTLSQFSQHSTVLRQINPNRGGSQALLNVQQHLWPLLTGSNL
jgi:hypothetical protein